MRECLSGTDEVDYLIQGYCIGGKFFLCAGNNNGDIFIFECQNTQNGYAITPNVKLSDSHSDIIRTILWREVSSISLFTCTLRLIANLQNIIQDNTLISGGEDGRVCCWKPGHAPEPTPLPTSTRPFTETPQNTERYRNVRNPYFRNPRSPKREYTDRG
jgi:hypothetical protein